MTYEEAQALARSRGVKKSVYETIRFLIIPLVKLVWRFRITGKDQIPKDGPVVIAPNHKSLYDSFFIAMATRSPGASSARSAPATAAALAASSP